MILHSYWRSTTSYRVRAALNLKGVSYRIASVDLTRGEQRSDSYMAMNPARGVPTLELDDGTVLTQSLAILDWLDVTYAEPMLLPADPLTRARVQAAAHAVALDVHPVNNLRVLKQLRDRFGAREQDTVDWMHHWMAEGFGAVERLVAPDTPFAFGSAPDLADLCITAQAYNAHRWGLDLAPFPAVRRIEAACLDIPEIAAAHPDAQPDAAKQ